MPVCPNCGSPQPADAAFCDECGARLGADENYSEPCDAPVGAATAPATAVASAASSAQAAIPAPPSVVGVTAEALVCPRCGARLEPGSKFCDMCGAPVRAGAPPPSAQPAPAVSPSPAPHPSGTAIPGYLVAQGTNATLRFPPGKTDVIVGRGDPASATFPDVDLSGHGGAEGGVSRQHARIFVQGSQVMIEDLHSTNRTYVNQQRLVPGQPHPLRHGDEVRCGQVRLYFYST